MIIETKVNIIYLGKGQKLIVKDHFGAILTEVQNE